MQAALKVAIELQSDVCIRGFREHPAISAGMDAFGPAPIARNGSTAWFQPDLSMRWLENRQLGLCVELRHCGQPPSSAIGPVLQQQIEMASRGVVRCSGVTQEGVSRQRLSLSLQSPYSSKASCQGSL